MKRSEALNLRKHIEDAVQSLPDAAALEAVVLHPVWKVDIAYSARHTTGLCMTPFPMRAAWRWRTGSITARTG